MKAETENIYEAAWHAGAPTLAKAKVENERDPLDSTNTAVLDWGYARRRVLNPGQSPGKFHHSSVLLACGASIIARQSKHMSTAAGARRVREGAEGRRPALLPRV